MFGAPSLFLSSLMNSRASKALRRQIAHANVTLSAGAWRVVKRAWDGGARTIAQLTRDVRLVRDVKGRLHGLTPKEEHLLRAIAATTGQLESDARVADAVTVVLCTAALGAVALGVAIAVARMLP